MVQSWLDDGDEEKNPQEIKTPFLVTPAITRINEKEGRTIKVSYLEGNLPKDKESIYWFNTLEVPPKSKEAQNSNHLQLNRL
nr:fimbria/pilus periplasmic chaperone [Serratia marcescens]